MSSSPDDRVHQHRELHHQDERGEDDDVSEGIAVSGEEDVLHPGVGASQPRGCAAHIEVKLNQETSGNVQVGRQ